MSESTEQLSGYEVGLREADEQRRDILEWKKTHSLYTQEELQLFIRFNASSISLSDFEVSNFSPAFEICFLLYFMLCGL